MSILIATVLDYTQAEHELDVFKAWLDANDEFDETAVVAELKAKKDLCLLLGVAAGRGQPDCYKHEFEIQGVLRADFVVGSRSNKHFVLVEFER